MGFVVEFVNPVLLSFGSLKLYTYGFFMALAFIVTHKLVEIEFARLKVSIESTNVLIAAIVGGIVGAKIHYVLTWNVDALFDINTGLSFQGGLIGGALLVCLYTKYAGEAVHKVCDAAGPLIPLGHAIGKLGCFFAGDGCYGNPTSVWWGMSFPNGLLPTRKFVHPAPLYEFTTSMSLFIYFWTRRQSRLPFDNFTRVVAGMCFSRILVELWRDHNVVIPLGFLGGINQFQLLALLAGCVALLIRNFILKPFMWKMQPVVAKNLAKKHPKQQ